MPEHLRERLISAYELVLSRSTAARPGVLALWELAQGGLFTVGIVKLGAHFSGVALATAMSLAMVIYTLGGTFAPPAMGAAMALLGPAGLVYGLAALAVVGVTTTAGRHN